MNMPAQPAVCTDVPRRRHVRHAGLHRLPLRDRHAPRRDRPQRRRRRCPRAPTCHAGYQKHAGKKGCTSLSHQGDQVPPRRDHERRQEGLQRLSQPHARRQRASRSPSARRATRATRRRRSRAPSTRSRSATSRRAKCGICHSKRVHAAADGGSLTCQTCHKSSFHGRQAIPGSTVCSNCHGRLSHACRLRLPHLPQGCRPRSHPQRWQRRRGLSAT